MPDEDDYGFRDAAGEVKDQTIELPTPETKRAKKAKKATTPRKKKYPDPSDFKNTAIAKKINGWLDEHDPHEKETGSKCEVGEAVAATVYYYKDVDVHPLGWVAINSCLYLGTIFVHEWQKGRQEKREVTIHPKDGMGKRGSRFGASPSE